MLILPQKLFERVIKICRSLSHLKRWSIFFLGFRFFYLSCMCHTFRSYILLHISIIIIMYICILVLLTLFCRIIISSLDSLVAKTSFEHTPRGSIRQGEAFAFSQDFTHDDASSPYSFYLHTWSVVEVSFRSPPFWFDKRGRRKCKQVTYTFYYEL